MKIKLLSIAIATLFFNSNSNAQGFKLGVKAGTDIQKVTGKSFNEGFNFGYHVGGFAQVKLSSKIALQPEVYFSQVNLKKGNSINSLYPAFNSLKEVNLSYLNIPILLNIKASPLLAFQVGPQYGILLNQNSDILADGKEAFKKGDFSMTGGVQFNISSFIIYGRYIVGLNELNDIDNRESWKSQTIHVGVGYKIL